MKARSAPRVTPLQTWRGGRRGGGWGRDPQDFKGFRARRLSVVTQKVKVHTRYLQICT